MRGGDWRPAVYVLMYTKKYLSHAFRKKTPSRFACYLVLFPCVPGDNISFRLFVSLYCIMTFPYTLSARPQRTAWPPTLFPVAEGPRLQPSVRQPGLAPPPATKRYMDEY